MSRFLFRFALVLPFVFATARGQTPTQSSSTAVSLASASLQAVLGSTSLADATVQGRVNYTVGSDEDSGTFTLVVKGNQESRLTLGLSSGQSIEVRQGQSGAWVDLDGTTHSMATHNCLVDASAIFPALSLLGVFNDSQVASSYIGQTSLDGNPLDHIQIIRTLTNQTVFTNEQLRSLSAMDIYLDPISHLPAKVSFDAHPDNNLFGIIPIEFRFLDYQSMNGIIVPTHIKKLVQGCLSLELFVTDVRINSDVPEHVPSLVETGGSHCDAL